MNKKIKACGILGIIESLYLIVFGYVCYALSALILALICIAETESFMLSLFPVFSIMCMVGGLTAFVGSIICFKKIKVGKYVILASSILSVFLQIYLIILGLDNFNSSSIVGLSICLIALILITITPILAFRGGKEKQQEQPVQ